MSRLTAASLDDLPKRFDSLFHQLLQASAALTPAGTQSPKFVVALSGGADSVALLRLLLSAGYQQRLRCVHINHQLQPQASDWASFCESLCAELGVPFEVLEVQLDPELRKAKGEEAAAREARYCALCSGIKGGELLLTAHHADDQVETLLHRLERGTGLRGLQGINSVSSRRHHLQNYLLLRPLLGFSKAELLAYLDHLGQPWCEDPSNEDTGYRRNYYRQLVVPQLGVVLRQRLLAISKLAAEALQAFEQDYVVWVATRISQSEQTSAIELQPNDFLQPELLQMRLQRWLQHHGLSLPKSRLHELLRQLERGTALGARPSYSVPAYSLYIRKYCLAVKVSGTKVH